MLRLPSPEAVALGLLGAFLMTRAVPASAEAPRLSIGTEGGVGTMLASYQRNHLNERFDLEGSLRLGASIANPLSVQLVGRTWWFPSSAGYARATLLGAGARLEPAVGRGRLWLDADAGLGLTGSATRFAFDVGAGYDFAASHAFGVGPFLRYGQVVATSHDYPSDAKSWAGGLSVTYRFVSPSPGTPPQPPPSRPATPADTDGDGVPDADDVCPREPTGVDPDPDPLHRGCPSRDTDGDGIVDHLDRCAAVPAGPHPDPERAGCPDGDADGDGFRDHVDACPTTSPGLHPDPTRPGCPAPDRDGDSVPDVSDACPDQPGAPSSDPKKNGCPGMVRVELDRLLIDRPVYFATGKDRILPKSFPVLRAIADALKATPEIKRVSVNGHADVRGTAEYNLDLSRRRADNIKAFLVAQGIAVERLETRGFGNTRPVDDNATEVGRAKNRRVEFLILYPSQNAIPEAHP
jgi:outer membrane protein OmpA-like peptidoglycan-associated protein